MSFLSFGICLLYEEWVDTFVSQREQYGAVLDALDADTNVEILGLIIHP